MDVETTLCAYWFTLENIFLIACADAVRCPDRLA